MEVFNHPEKFIVTRNSSCTVKGIHCFCSKVGRKGMLLMFEELKWELKANVLQFTDTSAVAGHP